MLNLFIDFIPPTIVIHSVLFAVDPALQYCLLIFSSLSSSCELNFALLHLNDITGCNADTFLPSYVIMQLISNSICIFLSHFGGVFKIRSVNPKLFIVKVKV